MNHCGEEIVRWRRRMRSLLVKRNLRLITSRVLPAILIPLFQSRIPRSRAHPSTFPLEVLDTSAPRWTPREMVDRERKPAGGVSR